MNFWPEEHLTPAQGDPVSDTLSLEEAWARFPRAMERANVGIGDLMSRPGFTLRLWDDSRTVIAQAAATQRERERHILRGMLRSSSWPLLINGITHGMDRTGGGKRVPSWCGKQKVPKKDQAWMDSRGRDVDCMGCIATGRTVSPRHSRAELEGMRWTVTAKWQERPGVWTRYGWTFSSHPRCEPGRLEGEDEIRAPEETKG